MKEQYQNKVFAKFSAMDMDDRTRGAKDDYCMISQEVTEPAEEVLPKTLRVQKQDRMVAEVLELMNERRKMKNHTVEYELLDKKVRKKCREAKDNFYNKKCAIEDL